MLYQLQFKNIIFWGIKNIFDNSKPCGSYEKNYIFMRCKTAAGNLIMYRGDAVY